MKTVNFVFDTLIPKDVLFMWDSEKFGYWDIYCTESTNDGVILKFKRWLYMKEDEK